MIAAGQHRVSYAYPTSRSATRVGRAKQGAHVVYVGDGVVGFDTREAALAHARSLGTTPDRWSTDHPDNLRFLSEQGAAS